MRYLGGKVRQAKRIRAAITALRGDRYCYLEPFVGGGSTFAAVAPDFERAVAGDVVPDLILFWEAVADGWVPPATMSAEEYEGLRHASPSPMRAWAMFAASYNGRPWAGYGPVASGRDYLAESHRSTIRKGDGMVGAEFRCCPYWEHEPDERTVVYCDPPYSGTTGYGTEFDHDRFWRTAAKWSSAGALVIVSEYEAPVDWVSVEAWDRSATVDSAATRVNVEHLYVHATNQS